MLLRTAAMLLLCASAGLCATLALHQTSEPEEESLAAAAAAAPVDGVGQVTAGEPQANPLSGGDGLGGTLAGSEAVADGADGGAANKLETEEGDGPAGDAATRPPPPQDGGNDIRPIRAMMRDRAKTQEESGWSINSIRSSFQSAHGYFNSLVELVGGRDGVCQYRCRYGERPSVNTTWQHTNNYKLP